MRVFAEEKKLGTDELLLTSPVSITHIVLGKFLAAWLFLAIALLLTFPMVLTVAYLGDPDGGLIFINYHDGHVAPAGPEDADDWGHPLTDCKCTTWYPKGRHRAM